jgi:hypothetical protein
MLQRQGLASVLTSRRPTKRKYPTLWSIASLTFQGTLRTCRKMGQGCTFCTTGECCLVMQEHFRELELWRDEMREMEALGGLQLKYLSF